ncbi:Bet v1-like protein [Patellaria atrata CBS 101060]|uniref:Bet v1-like protein n=1 Tax=Patellaria atrata CBS 101060 TaxID=1346257 RepID=A0A9P4VS59_9PEZI|nr:Bet v1-like protein [Patellaria atrata CBS 101060]
MSDTRIPTSTFVSESTVIEAPFAEVWHKIKLANFADFWSKLEKSDASHGANHEADVVKWKFIDGTELEVKQEAHSSIDHYITYSVISSKPALTYSSVVSTIRVYPVTTGKHEGHAYVVWTGNFSSDADASVIEDAKFKRREALADLAKSVGQ